MLIGGRTLLTEILGWKNAPKPMANVLQAGRLRLVDVLGVSDEIPQSMAYQEPTGTDVVKLIQLLNSEERVELESMVCSP